MHWQISLNCQTWKESEKIFLKDSQDDYHKSGVAFTVFFLKENDYVFVTFFWIGVFVTVIEVQHSVYRFSVKIVLQEYILGNKLDLWPKLNHSNILPVVKIKKDFGTYISAFCMSACPTVLCQNNSWLFFHQWRKCFEEICIMTFGCSWRHCIFPSSKPYHWCYKLGNVMITSYDIPV